MIQPKIMRDRERERERERERDRQEEKKRERERESKKDGTITRILQKLVASPTGQSVTECSF